MFVVPDRSSVRVSASFLSDVRAGNSLRKITAYVNTHMLDLKATK